MADESLLPLREVTSHLRVLGESCVGWREIPVDKIVASLDRSVDFDRLFRTRRRDLRRRLDALQVAFADRPMPPITGYEAGGLELLGDGPPPGCRPRPRPPRRSPSMRLAACTSWSTATTGWRSAAGKAGHSSTR